MIKICKSAVEYVLPMLKIKSSSVNVRFIFFILSHILNSPMRDWVSLTTPKHMRNGLFLVAKMTVWALNIFYCVKKFPCW